MERSDWLRGAPSPLIGSVTHDGLIQTEVGHGLQVQHGQVTLGVRGHSQAEFRSAAGERDSGKNLEPFRRSDVPEVSGIPADEEQTAPGTETWNHQEKEQEVHLSR